MDQRGSYTVKETILLVGREQSHDEQDHLWYQIPTYFLFLVPNYPPHSYSLTLPLSTLSFGMLHLCLHQLRKSLLKVFQFQPQMNNPCQNQHGQYSFFPYASNSFYFFSQFYFRIVWSQQHYKHSQIFWCSAQSRFSYLHFSQSHFQFNPLIPQTS